MLTMVGIFIVGISIVGIKTFISKENSFQSYLIQEKLNFLILFYTYGHLKCPVQLRVV